MNGIMNLDSYNVAELNHNEVVDTNGGLFPWLPFAVLSSPFAVSMIENWNDVRNGFIAGWNANN